MFSLWLTLTTTTPFWARCIPGSHSEVPESKPPPCSHTITGIEALVSVVQTFSTQEFFSDILSSGILRPFCIACGPQWSHTRTVSHLGAGLGGINRSTVAYGMPRKPMDPSWSKPFTSPESVLTTIGSEFLTVQASGTRAASSRSI